MQHAEHLVQVYICRDRHRSRADRQFICVL